MSFVMAAAMTGCGKDKTESVPDLLDPVSTNEAYRPVTYGDIGRMVIKTGTIVPTDNCYYYDTSATLSKVYVNVGDKVKKELFLPMLEVEVNQMRQMTGVLLMIHLQVIRQWMMDRWMEHQTTMHFHII